MKLKRLLAATLGIAETDLADDIKITESDIGKIIRAMVTNAMKGDVQSAKEILNRMYGLPKQPIVMEQPDADDNNGDEVDYSKLSNFGHMTGVHIAPSEHISTDSRWGYPSGWQEEKDISPLLEPVCVYLECKVEVGSPGINVVHAGLLRGSDKGREVIYVEYSTVRCGKYPTTYYVMLFKCRIFFNF